jgi:hypothetical protein
MVVAFAMGVTLVTSAFAQKKTYTPAQLKMMVESGKPPRQGTPTTQTKSMSYSKCVETMMFVVNSVKPSYPTSTVMSTNIARIEKVWTNDAAMTITCSAPDGKLVITSAPYL